MAPNLVHSVDASVIHAVLADMGENESVVSVHDAVGTHLRDVGTVREVFQKCFHHAYGYENIYELGPLLDVKKTRISLVGMKLATNH